MLRRIQLSLNEINIPINTLEQKVLHPQWFRISLVNLFYHVGLCQQDRSSPPHRTEHHTVNVDSAEHWDTRENKLDHRDHKSAHCHTAELQGGRETENNQRKTAGLGKKTKVSQRW